VLRSYGASHTAAIQMKPSALEFASGSKDEVKGIAQFFGLRYYHDIESNDEQVIHSMRTAIVGADGKVLSCIAETSGSLRKSWANSEV